MHTEATQPLDVKVKGTENKNKAETTIPTTSNIGQPSSSSVDDMPTQGAPSTAATASTSEEPQQQPQPQSWTDAAISWGIWAGNGIVDGMDKDGEVFATFLGFNESKYQYVINELERKKALEEARRQALEAEEAEELSRLEEAHDQEDASPSI